MKFKSLILALLILFLSVGSANAFVLNFREGDIGEKLNYAFSSGINIIGNKTGVTTNVSTESSLTSAALNYGAIALQAGSAKTIGLADGVPGQMITIYMSVYDGGAITISRAAFPETTHGTGWTTIQFTAVNQSVTLLWLDNTSGWIITGEPDAAVTFTNMTAGAAVTAGTSVTAGTTVTATTDSKFRTSVYANGHKAGVTTNVSTESTLTSAALSYGMIRKVTSDSPTTAMNTVGLNDGVVGQMVTIQLITKGTPSWVISKTSFPATTHSTGWSTLTFDTSLDSITLLWMDDSSGWVIVGNNGVVVA